MIFIEAIPVNAEATVPQKYGRTDVDSIPVERSSGSERMFAPMIAGIESKKEYLTAYSLLKPEKRPDETVAPDLDRPGNTASNCVSPTDIAWDSL